MSDSRNASRRALFRGSLEVLVLAVLADGDRYGYVIQRRVREASGQSVTPGSLYPLLHRLEEDGLVEARWEADTGRSRKWYTLTDAGRRRLRESAADWQAMIARMQGLVLPALRRVASRPPGR